MFLRIQSPLLHDDTFRRLCRSRDLLAASYQEQITLDHAAREACLSSFHFHRLFASAFGETPHDFLTRIRMDRAKQLLLRGEMSVTEVCLEVGYSSLGSFSHKFRSLAGQTPTGYQREARRVFGYRALRFARGDAQPLAGFDEQAWVPAAGFDRRALPDLLADLNAVRRATIALFRGFDAAALARKGAANNREITVRALAYVIAGHERHHVAILRERYRV